MILPTRPVICAGKRAYSDCHSPARYWVDDRPACGVHLAQLVKAALFMTPPGESVSVRDLADAPVPPPGPRVLP